LRILMIKMDPPYPLESGTDWVSYHLLKTLLVEHEVTYVTLTRAARDEEAVQELERLGTRVLAMRQPNVKSVFHRVAYKVLYLVMALLTGVPLVVWYNTPWALRRRVKRLLAEESFDLIHVEYWYAAPYARYAKQGRRVLLKHDVACLADRRLLEQRPRGLARFWEERNAERRKRYEIRFCREFDSVLTLTQTDRDAFQKILGDHPPVKALPALVLPFEAEPGRSSGGAAVDGVEPNRRLVFVGHLGRSMVVDAVTWFCDEVLPRIQSDCPGVELEIVGSREDRVQHLAGRPGVRLAGFVRDVKSRMREAAVMVVPLRAGSGIKIKIVEAMMAGMAIVSTSVGAEGIEVRHGQELMIADDAEGFARCTLDLLRDPARRARLGGAARRFARDRYSSEATRQAVLDFYRDEIEEGGQRGLTASVPESPQGVSQAGV
jgi:glycosyltransferase involved in cell wall biosynthesis